MKFFGMGGFELVIILIVILLIFGPKNLPKLGNALGKTVSNLRSGMNEGKKKKEEEAEEADSSQEDAPASQTAEIVGEVEHAEDDVAEEKWHSEEEVNDQEPLQDEDSPADEAIQEGEDSFSKLDTPPEPMPLSDEVAPEGEKTADAPKKVRRVVKRKAVKPSEE